MRCHDNDNLVPRAFHPFFKGKALGTRLMIMTLSKYQDGRRQALCCSRITAGFKRPLDRQPLSRFRGRNASVILLSFYCISLVLIKSVLIKPVLIKSFEMKRPFMVWIGFISICCSKVAKEGKSCPRLLVLQRVAQKLPSTIYLCLLAVALHHY